MEHADKKLGILQPMEIPDAAAAPVREPVVFDCFDWVALVLGILLGALWFQVFSFKALLNIPGLGTTAFVLGALAAECVCLRGKIKPSRQGVLLVACTVLLAVSCGLFGDYSVRLINLAMLSCLTPASALALTGRDFPALEARVIPETVRLFLPNLFRHFMKPFRAVRRRERSFTGLWVAILTLVCAFPVIVVIVSLLTSADAVFSALLGSIGRALTDSLDRGRFIVTWLKVGVFGLMLFSFLYFLAHREPESRQTEEPAPLALPPLPCAVILVVLDVIYAVFAAVQFAVFFGPMRGTYAESARQGFFQLVAVAGINLLASFLTAKADGKGKKAVQILTWALLGLTAVILASAAARMCRYIGVYGLSLLRAMTWVFMLWIAGALVLAGVKTVKPEKHVFPALLASFLLLWTLFSLCDIDRRVAAFNRSAFERGAIAEFDEGYIESLGPGEAENRDAFWANKVLFPMK